MNRKSSNDNRRVRWRDSSDGKGRCIIITKTTMVVIFNLQNSHLLTLSLPTEEALQVNGQNRPVANLSVVDFHSQLSEMPTPKPLNTQLSVFLLLHW